MGSQPLQFVRGRVAAFFGVARTLEEKIEYWQQEIDRQARKYGFRDIPEIADLRQRVPEFLEGGFEEHLRHAVSRVNPFVNVPEYAPVLVHHESPFDHLVLSPTTVFDYHYPLLREEVALIGIMGAEVRFYDARHRNLAKYIANVSIPEAALLQGRGRLPPAAQLVIDYTGLRLGVEDLVRMDSASFHKKGGHWFMRLGIG